MSSLHKWAKIGVSTGCTYPRIWTLERFNPAAGYNLRQEWASKLYKTLGIQVIIQDWNLKGQPLDGILAPPTNLQSYQRGNIYGRGGPFIFLNLTQQSLVESPALIIALGQTCPSIAHSHFIFVNLRFSFVPFYGWEHWWKGVVVIKAWQWHARRGLDAALHEIVHRRRSCYMSIEGQRSRTGDLSPYKTGAARLAIQARTPIVPIVFHGAAAYDLLPFGEWAVRPGRLVMELLPPLCMQGVSLSERHELTHRLREMAEARRAAFQDASARREPGWQFS
eukprot:CAMPEP_0177680728 /NCGR_PEP_ID=MMETSP0447-20121125/30330_1 /TAXON_ID=0 /ORGANISM="Stygamoeba regulata, Strain BSH-02190019" /LENGTH=278 /DNA_ID=CAMNT_0019190083 /DNA_START=44 /DNA_END=879 /DNA_ORIENTATION=-